MIHPQVLRNVTLENLFHIVRNIFSKLVGDMFDTITQFTFDHYNSSVLYALNQLVLNIHFAFLYLLNTFQTCTSC